MKKITGMLFLILVLTSIQVLWATAPVPLEAIARPSMFLVNYDRVYILEKATVYIYSLKDFTLLKQFGKAGEGPREFKMEDGGRPLSMSFFTKQLLVNSLHKISYFDLDGKFIREQKVPVDKLLFPVNGKFLGIGPTAGDKDRRYIGFTLFDTTFATSKTIFLGDFEISNPRRMVLPVTSFTYNPVYKGKIFINANSEEFKINVYNGEGEIEYTIEKNYPKLKIPENFRDEALEFFKQSPQFKRAYEYVKQILEIRDTFPPIRDLQLVDDAIYVITFKREGKLWECIKLDLKGKELARTFVPLDRYEHLTFYPILYSVYQGKIYTLVENEDEETWEIHTTECR